MFFNYELYYNKTPYVSKGTLKNLMQIWGELEVEDDCWKTHYLLV